jgi:putative FmdB family regulatory protein
VPTYEYTCSACDTKHDIVQKMTDPTLTECPSCGQPTLRKVFGGVGVVFKGSGFYRTDSRSGNDKGGSETKKKDTSSASGSSDKSSSSSNSGSSSNSSSSSSSGSSGSSGSSSSSGSSGSSTSSSSSKAASSS